MYRQSSVNNFFIGENEESFENEKEMDDEEDTSKYFNNTYKLNLNDTPPDSRSEFEEEDSSSESEEDEDVPNLIEMENGSKESVNSTSEGEARVIPSAHFEEGMSESMQNYVEPLEQAAQHTTTNTFSSRDIRAQSRNILRGDPPVESHAFDDNGAVRLVVPVEHRNPKSIKQAMKGPHRKEVIDSCVKEVGIIFTKCSKLVKLDQSVRQNIKQLEQQRGGRVLVNSMIVLTVKELPAELQSEVDMHKWKSRWVYCGSQAAKNLLSDIYAPCSQMESHRLSMAVAVDKGWILEVSDFCSAFLHGKLDELLFMMLPPVFEDKEFLITLKKSLTEEVKKRLDDDFLLLLDNLDGLSEEELKVKVRSFVVEIDGNIYGTPTAPLVWHRLLNNAMVQELGFVKSVADPCVYSYFENKVLKASVNIHVDDALIMGENQHYVDLVKSKMSSMFEVKFLGPIGMYLGMEIDYNVKEGSLKIKSRKYVENLLEKLNMKEVNPSATPAAPSVILGGEGDGGTLVEAKPMQSKTGSLLYLMRTSNPFIAYAVKEISRRAAAPTTTDETACKRIIQYLKGKLDFFVEYIREGSIVNNVATLTGYSDSSFADTLPDRKSTLASLIFLGTSLVSWKSKTCKTVCTSTFASELNALVMLAKDLIWTTTWLGELGIAVKKPIVAFCDNNSVCELVKRDTTNERTKHLVVKFYFLRDLIRTGFLAVEHIPGDYQLADVLTKPLAAPRFNELMYLICQGKIGNPLKKD